MLENVKSIIFDFDGTLHQTTKIYTPALAKAVKILQDKGYIDKFEVDDNFSGKLLGYSAEDAWKIIYPNATKETVAPLISLVGQSMEENMLAKKGSLYEGTEEVLKTLKEKGYDLYLLSNCSNRYLNLACEIYGIKKYFKKLIPAQTFDYIDKGQIIKILMDDMAKEIIVVGDRFHDIEGAKANNLKAIFASYGYGKKEESAKADYKINNIIELIK